MQMYKKSNRFVCTRNLFGCKEEQEAKCRAAEETERRVSTVKDATKPEKNANQQRDEQESKTGTSERKNSTTDREMWEIEWVFVKASNKASQGRKKAGGWTSETPTLHPKKRKNHIGNVPLNASPIVRRPRPRPLSCFLTPWRGCQPRSPSSPPPRAERRQKPPQKGGAVTPSHQQGSPEIMWKNAGRRFVVFLAVTGDLF